MQNQESDPSRDSNATESSSPGIQSESSPLNIPIALKKRNRKCTQHPISKYVNENLSPSFSAFTSQLFSVDVPTNINEALSYIHEALSVPKWKETVFEEMKALERNGT